MEMNIKRQDDLQTFKYDLIHKATRHAHTKLDGTSEFHDFFLNHLHAIESAFFYMDGFFRHVTYMLATFSESAFSEELGESVSEEDEIETIFNR